MDEKAYVERNPDTPEQWVDEKSDSLWERTPGSRTFSLVRFRGKQVDKRWSIHEFARALNCGISTSSDDGASTAEPVLFPTGFKFSPNTGSPIAKIGSRINTWLPTSGSENLKSGLLRGGCLTSHALTLKGDSHLFRDSDHELPLPGHGLFRFCVGTFGLSSTFLLALQAEQGALYCLLPSCEEWVELTSTRENTPYLGSVGLSNRAWSIEAVDLEGDTVLFWPSDRGLVAIRINVLSLIYETKVLAEGRCVSVPRIVRDKVYVLIEQSNGATGVVSADTDWNSSTPPQELMKSDIPNAKWAVAVATPSELIWLSDLGQVVLHPNASKYFYIPWEIGVKPQFLLGGPHCSPDGNLWIQALHPTIHEGEKGFCFVQLGRFNPELRASFGARMLTGRSSIKVEKLLKNDPWIEPTVVTEMGNDEVVVPILESMEDNTVLVLRTEHMHSITRFFERTDELITTRFQIMGQHGKDGFYVKRLREPWTATAFIFQNVLYLYHPDIGSLPGWLTSCSEG